MWNKGRICLALAVLSLITSLVGHRYGVVNGLGKAMFGVFLILFFIDRFFGERDPSK